MKKVSKPILILCIALAVLLLGGAVAFFSLYAPMGGHWYKKSSASITTDAVELDALSSFPQLKVLVALEAELTVEEAESIHAQYPTVDLVWSVPLSSGKAASTSDEITLTAEEDFVLLPYFSNLSKVQVEGAALCPALLSAMGSMPQCQFAYEITLDGETFPMDAQVLTLSSQGALGDLESWLPYFTALKHVDVSSLPLTVEEVTALQEALPEVDLAYTLSAFGETFPMTLDTLTLNQALSVTTEELIPLCALLPELRTVDLTGCTVDRNLISSLLVAFADVQVLWTDAVYGASDSSAQALTLTEGTLEGLQTYLPCFPALQQVDITALSLPNEDTAALLSTFPNLTFAYTVELDGERILWDVTDLNWDNRTIQDVNSLYTGLPLLKLLRKITFHHSSLSNEELAQLREANPQTKVVWTVKLSRKQEVATDSIAYSTMSGGNNTNRLTSEDVAVLQYCTELIVLDLGHNAISDLSWIESLTNLQVLILADNKITDMTSVGKLTKLKYLELFMNKIVDISAVENLPELLDFNMCWTRVEDATPLLKCTKLERIWLASCSNLTEESKEALTTAFSNATFDFDSPSCTRKGWREHPRYEAFRSMFTTQTPVSPFLPEE